MKLGDDIIAVASGAFLCEELENYSQKTEEEIEEFVYLNMWEPMENQGYEVGEVLDMIIAHAERIKDSLF